MFMGRGGEDEKGLGNGCRVTPSLRYATTNFTFEIDWRVLDGSLQCSEANGANAF